MTQMLICPLTHCPGHDKATVVLEDVDRRLELAFLIPVNEAHRLARVLGLARCPCVPVLELIDGLLAHFNTRVLRVVLDGDEAGVSTTLYVGENHGEAAFPCHPADAPALAANNVDTPPEKNRNFEVGAKVGILNDTVSLQDALFRLDKTNARTLDPVTLLQVLQGAQRVHGFELGVTGRPLPRWNLFAGYTYLDSKFLESQDLQNNVPIKGKQLQNTLRHSATLWTMYDIGEQWQVGTGVFFVGERFANTSNTNLVPETVRWDATVAYQLNKNLQLRLNAINLTDELYSQPDEYDGGELVVDDLYGAHTVKLPAGDMVLYPASSLHHVTAVTRGIRFASFFWIQSMVRDDSHRTQLFELDMAINQVSQALSQLHPAVVALTNCSHNLLRRYAEV